MRIQCTDIILTHASESAKVAYLPTADLPPVVNSKRARLPRSVVKLRSGSKERASPQKMPDTDSSDQILSPVEALRSVIAHLEAVTAIAAHRLAEIEAGDSPEPM